MSDLRRGCSALNGRRITTLVAIVALAAVCAGGWALASHLHDTAVPATWQLGSPVTLAESSTEIPVLVRERSCASGQLATGRIRAAVSYSDQEVTISVGVQPLGGFQTCPAVLTPYVVELSEPLGDRTLVDGHART